MAGIAGWTEEGPPGPASLTLSAPTDLKCRYLIADQLDRRVPITDIEDRRDFHLSGRRVYQAPAIEILTVEATLSDGLDK